MHCVNCGKQEDSGKQLCDSCVKKYARVSPSTPSPLLTTQVAGLIAARRISEAQRLCQDALHSWPQEADVYEASGDVAVAQGQWREAAMEYSSALQLHPVDHNALQQKMEGAIEAMRSGAPALPPAAPPLVPLDAITTAPLPIAVEAATPVPLAAVAIKAAPPIHLIITPVEKKPIIEEPEIQPITIFNSWQLNPRLLALIVVVALIIVLSAIISACQPWRHRYQPPADVQAIVLDDEKD